MKTLHVQNLDLHIKQKWFCKNLTMTFTPGEVWGILGANGCGKTTFLQTLAGLHPPNGGEVMLAQHKLATLVRKTIARDIGILLQDNHFAFAQTIWDYCAAARYPHLGYWQQLSAHDLHIIRQTLTQMKLDTFANRSVMELSGGEKRRLAIAALITQNPIIYLLDEPTNHLDIQHQMQVLHFFAQQAKNHSALVMMTLHDVNLAQQFCDKILLMFGDGEILQGPTNELLTPKNVERLYQHPLRMIQQGEKRYWLS